MRFAVLVSGRGSNLQAILDERAAGRLAPAEIACVVSDNPTAGALDRKAHPDRASFEAELLAALAARGVEAVALAGFMRILSADFVRAFHDRILNIHPSLLPAFPGAHGVRDALAWGVKVAGCTVHLVDDGTDTGPIVLQAAVPVLPGDDELALARRILVEEHRLLPEAVRLLAAGRITREGRVARVHAGG